MARASQREVALMRLRTLRTIYTNPDYKQSGWDRTLSASIMQAMLIYAGRELDGPESLHLAFLDILIELLESEETINQQVNRKSA